MHTASIIDLSSGLIEVTDFHDGARYPSEEGCLYEGNPMASPFSIFRRNQKLGMAVLTLMAMFAFVFLDSFSRMGQSVGSSTGQTLVKTSVGNYDRAALGQLIMTRRRANDFLASAWSRAAQVASENKQRMGSQQPFQFSYGRGNLEKDVILGELFRREAQRIGIVVSKEAVDSFIEQVTEGKLSSTMFRDLTREMQISGKEVHDVLATELQARYYFLYFRPQVTTSPAQLWDYYHRLNVRESIEVATIPVSEFTSQVPEPSESELKAFFEKNKNRLPYEYPDLERAGFKQAAKVQLQYLTISFEEAEKQIAEVTEKDITEYYEKNKEAQYRNRPFPETSPQKPAEKPAEEKPAGETPPATPEKKPEETAPEKPAETKPEESKPAEPPADKPKTEEAPTIIPDKPAADSPPQESGEKKQSRRSSSALNSIAQASPRSPVNAKGLFLVEDKEASTEAKKEEPPTESKPETPTIDPAKPAAEGTTPPAEEKKPTEEPKPEEAKPETPPTEEKKPDAPATEKPADQPAESTPPAKQEPEPEFRPLDDDLKAEIRETIERQRTTEKLQEIAKNATEKLSDIGIGFNVPTLAEGSSVYFDLNDDGQKTAGEPAVEVQGKLNPDRIDPKQKWKLHKIVAPLSAKKLTDLSTEVGMKYAETDLVLIEQLKEIKGLGTSVEMESGPVNPFEANRQPIENLVYTDEVLYRPLRLENPDTGDIYIGWKVQFVPTHIPDYADEGIKDQVLQAWKMEKGRPLAEKRANELAELAKSAQKPLSEALADQKVNSSDAEPIKVNTTGAFSWLKTSTIPGPNPLASEVRPEMSDVPFVKKPGEKFMRKIFEELKVGEIGVSHDFDVSNYLLVQVKDREPTEEALAEKRNEFFTSQLFGFSFGGMRFGTTPYDVLSEIEGQQAVVEWVQRIEKKYQVEFLNEDEMTAESGE